MTWIQRRLVPEEKVDLTLTRRHRARRAPLQVRRPWSSPAVVAGLPAAAALLLLVIVMASFKTDQEFADDRPVRRRPRNWFNFDNYVDGVHRGADAHGASSTPTFILVVSRRRHHPHRHR